MNASPCLLLQGWSECTKLYPYISRLSQSDELLELRYVTERQITSNLLNTRYALKRQLNIIVSRYTVKDPMAY